MGGFIILSNKNGLFIILMCVLTIFVVTSVSAADLNQTDEVAIDDASVEQVDTLEIKDNDDNVILEENDDEDAILEMAEDEEVLKADYQQFSDIQKKINSEPSGGTVYINGTYYGFGVPLIINKPIKLVGLGSGAELKANTNTNLKQCAIYINSSDVTIDNIIIKNGCDQWGGGIYLELDEVYTQVGGVTYRSYIPKCKGVNISNCQFKDNSADGNHGYGGAICFWTENSLITNCTFINNHCTDFGGAIYTNGQNNRIENCQFSYNYISNEISEEGLEICRGGGAIYSDCQSLKIDNCTFTDNSAREAYGGALRLAASFSLKNSNFKDNHALLAKAIYCGSEIFTISGNTFSLEYKEDPNTLFYGLTADDLKHANTFNKTRIDSSVKFSAGMIFEYGTTGSIYVTVDGGDLREDDIRVLGHNEAKIDFVNNVITVSNLAVGTYTLRVTTIPDDDHFSVDGDLKVTVKKATAVIKAEKLTVAYKKGSMWTINLINSKTNKPISNMKLSVRVFSGKKSKIITVQTNSKGEASYQTKGLSKGNHKVVVSATDGRYNFNTLTSSIKVVKQTPLKFKLKKKIDDKDGSLRSYLVLNKKTNKGVNGIKIKVLFYTGKKYVVYTFKTKKLKGKKGTYNGAFGFATNKFSAGKHIVKIMPASIKYKGSITTSIKLSKKATAANIPKYMREV